MSKQVAVITGAASGIGLALTKHLLSQGWRVVMADMNAKAGTQLAAELGHDALFIQTDVSVFTQQSELFDRAFEWGGSRLDFFAANAGIDDKQSLYEADRKLDGDGKPMPLNLLTLRVDLDAIIQGIWLFAYYARMNRDVTVAKVVITSSAAGL
jgi:NAD(P)-dependent dehydrogenase (short-subunit alcohol dehydrogenase family)